MRWSTEAEIAFVRALGLHRRRCYGGEALSIEAVSLQERLMLLRKYRAAMRLRSDWDAIDPIVMAQEVDRLIAALEQRLAAERTERLDPSGSRSL